MRLGTSLALASLLGALGCGLNPQPEPPSEELVDGAAGKFGGGGQPGAPAGGSTSAGRGGATSSGGGGASWGGGAGGAGGAVGAGGAALPDSPTPYCTGEDGTGTACAPSGAKTGEDGAFQGPVSTFVDEGDRLRDTLTQLEWQKLAVGPLPVADAPAVVCPVGARAPSLLEVLTLADFGRADGMLPPFGVVAPHFGVTPGGFASLALPSGASTHTPMASGVVRCVSGPSFKVSFVVDPGGATVTSSLGLRFERGDAGAELSWAAALDACHAKGVGARLPTVKELFTLVDDVAYPGASAAFDAPVAGGPSFWSSTADPTGPRAFVVSFATGDLLSDAQAALHHVRCVVP